jgi:hypothetical protein
MQLMTYFVLQLFVGVVQKILNFHRLLALQKCDHIEWIFNKFLKKN